MFRAHLKITLKHADSGTAINGIKVYFAVGIKKGLMQFLRFMW
jgi:hypothetical protein